MKKYFKYIVLLLIVMPFSVKASSSYSVEMVSNQSNNKVVGTYSSYEEALKVMNNQNSTDSNVATIYKDGVPVDSKYAIFKFKPSNVYYLYRNSNDSTSYTYTHGSYGTDAALLGYSSNGRVKVMISGFVGWTDISNGVVTPISLMKATSISVSGTQINLRSSASTSSSKVFKNQTINGTFAYSETASSNGYTWYKITYNGVECWIAGGDWVTTVGGRELNTYYNYYSPSGNLIHHYDVYNGSGYSDAFSNLGTAPDYLKLDSKFYSFDSNYFYTSITTMLDDYRSGIYTHSFNYDKPYYSYYMYLTSHSKSSKTASQLDNYFISKYGDINSKLKGTGQYFINAQETYGVNALLAYSSAVNESRYGTSSIALNKNNLFGYGAADSSAYASAYTYSSAEESIMDYATRGGSYSNATGKYYYGSHLGNKSSGKNVKYASDPYKGESEAALAFMIDYRSGGNDFNSSTIGVVKKGLSGCWVFSSPEQTDSAHIYTLKNPNSDLAVYDIPVNIVDKVTGKNGVEFYKIYTDLPASSGYTYGYIVTSEVYTANNQPAITASDKEIKVGTSFNILDGVSAYDKEDGNLTVTSSGSVDTSKEGEYKVTYTAVDKSNFHVSKTVTIKVVSDNNIIINASDKEIKQFSEFDYFEGIRASDDNGDLTNLITYEGSVDTSKAGNYFVTYKVSKGGKSVSKKITVKVIADEKPIITVCDKEIYVGSEFDYLDGVSASDSEDGELTNITYSGEVDTSKVGEYKVTYKVSDRNNQETTKVVTIKVVLNNLPVINASDKSVSQGSSFNALDGVSASDKEDGDLTSKLTYSGEVDTSKLGNYDITYFVTDSYNQTVTKKVTVSVIEKVLEEKEGWFHLEKVNFADDKLYISGFSVISGVNNDINSNIKHKLILKNQDNDKQYTFSLDNWNENIPYTPNDGSKYNYSNSWFNGSILLKDIPQGDYSIYIETTSNNYYTKQIVSNVEYINDIKRSYQDSEGRGYLIKENPVNTTVDLELFIRDSGLIAYQNTPVRNGILSDLYSYEFKNNKLIIVGDSFSLKTDYNKNVTREIVLENKETKEVVYRESIGYMENGPYKLTSLTNNDLSKAWFEANVDLSKLSKGTYVIYLRTKTDSVDGYSELSDYAYTSLKNTASINGNKVKLTRNSKQRVRIELLIE